MLSSVLRSPRAVQVNIAVVRAFVELRKILATHAHLGRKLDALESDASGSEIAIRCEICRLLVHGSLTREDAGAD